MDDHKQLNDYLEAILNLQCEDQETLKALGQESSQLLQKVQEINARVAGLQMEVMEVQDALHPPAPLEEEPERESPPAPASDHLLSLSWIGSAALLAPLLWNGIAAGVHALQGLAWDLDASGMLAMTACISVAWGLLLIAMDPPLNRALQKWEERHLANESEEDRAIEEFLNKRCSPDADHVNKN